MPVFRAPTSFAAGPPDLGDYPDGPTERLGSPPAPPGPAAPGRRVAVTAVMLAGLAVVLAGVATVLAWRALNRAPAPAPAASPAGPASAASAASYADETLKIRAGCTGVTFLDLDEPRVGAPGPVSDLRYDGRCGAERPRLALAPGAVAAGDTDDPRPDAAGCAKTVRTSPLGEGQLLPVAKGLVLCVQTSGSLVRLEVAEVTGDGTATVRATSWPAG